MSRLFKRFPWMILIAFQALLGIGAGLLVLSSQSVNTVSGHIRLDGLTIGDLPIDIVRSAIENYYKDKSKDGSISIEVDGSLSALKYQEFDVSVDIDKTLDQLAGMLPDNKLEQFFYGNKDIALKPEFTYNSGKLQKSLVKLLSPYEKEAVPGNYEVKNGELKLTPQVSGRKVDYARLELELKDKLFALTPTPYVIDTKSSPLFMEITNENDSSPTFNTLVSKSIIPLDGMSARAEGYLEALQGKIYDKNQEISLKALLDFSQFTDDVEKDLLNRIASAVYQAALPIDGVTILNRKPSNRPVSYTEPGLEAVIEGEEADLLIKNGTERPFMLLSEINGDTLTMYIASTGDIKCGTLMVQKKDQIPPPVITSVNKALSADETKVVSEGVPGFTAYVSRVLDDKEVELYHDQYQPISKIVETGKAPVIPETK